MRRMLLGLALLGFTSVYRECFEIVIFLQNLRELYGASVVLEGVVIGLLFTAAVGVLTFALHQRLPYRRLLIITGVMLLFVLIVAVGEQVNEMQLAGWIGTTPVTGLAFPAWMGTWFSLFGQLGDVHRPAARARARARFLRRRAVPARVAPAAQEGPAAHVAREVPSQPADVAVASASGQPLTVTERQLPSADRLRRSLPVF